MKPIALLALLSLAACAGTQTTTNAAKEGGDCREMSQLSGKKACTHHKEGKCDCGHHEEGQACKH